LRKWLRVKKNDDIKILLREQELEYRKDWGQGIITDKEGRKFPRLALLANGELV
jgi:hypothetical protein